MMNTLCGTMGSTKSETSSYTKLKQPTSPNESDSERSMAISNCEIEQKSLTPPSLNFPAIKSDLDAEAEVQSPDNSGWETFFSDHLDTDFMILSPVRNFPSPQASSYNYINYVNSMQGQSALGCSPPRYLSQIGSYKGKGLSPLHKVFNSPNNQYMQVENLSLPGIENDFLDHNIGGFGGSYQPTKLSSVTSNGSTQMFDSQNSFPEMLDYFGTQNALRSSGGSQLTNGKDIYNHMGSLLQHELHQDQQPTSSIATTLGSAGSSVQHNQQRHDIMMPFPMGSEQEEDSGLQLVHLLLECAKAVAEEDYMVARRYLHQLNRVITPLGDSMQRVASCFTEALTARLASTLTTKPSTSSTTKPFSPFPPNCMEILKIYQILYQACPYIKFAHFTANQAIFEAFEAEERVHVIDLDILQGYQWPAFMQALAARPNGAPFLRITGVGSSIEGVKETGRCLTELAHSLHIPFEFHPVAEELEDLKPHMFNRRVGEALAVNSVNRLHRVPGNYLGPLLAMIRDQAPNIVTIVEQEASHNGSLFLSRFLEALHYYSAIFDSLDATFPPESAQRAKVEQYIFAPEIRNIVACEGVERTARHEKLEKWRKIMEGKGFKGVALSGNAVTQSKILLGLYSCDGYTLREDKGCLLLGWQDRAILAASAWRC